MCLIVDSHKRHWLDNRSNRESGFFNFKSICILAAYLIFHAISTNPAFSITLHGRYLTFHGNPDTCITITSLWDTADTINVIYDTAISFPAPDTITNFSGYHRHHVELNGLQPSTKYYYRIQDKFGISHTDTDSFQTANILGSNNQLSLLLVSDFQPNAIPEGQAERDSIRVMIDTIRTQISRGRCPHPDLILNLGDFVCASTDANWDTIIAILDTLHELAPLLPTIGNHDGYRKGRLDSCGDVYHFNLPPSGLGNAWSGNHQYILDYQNIRFISLSMCDASRSWQQDKVTLGSTQYDWLDSLLKNKSFGIDFTIELHHVNLTPLPWNLPNAAPCSWKMTWQNGIYNDPEAQNTLYDTLRYEYLCHIRPKIEAAKAISIEGHAWFCAATTDIAASVYWGNFPIVCCAGGNGWNTNKQSFCTMNLSTDQVKVDYHKVDNWPNTAAVAAGYPCPDAANKRIFTIFQSPSHLLGDIHPIPKLIIRYRYNPDHTPAPAIQGSQGYHIERTPPQLIDLHWTAIPGAAQYYIYSSDTPTSSHFVLIDSTANAYYTHHCTPLKESHCFYHIAADPDAGLAELQP
ncbi:hypothetical protein AMJ86_03135 [bacterium SM23_57]|nr:MAG: hypothetical protein AMJ86_03135 [bacterium SM23_57]